MITQVRALWTCPLASRSMVSPLDTCPRPGGFTGDASCDLCPAMARPHVQDQLTPDHTSYSYKVSSHHCDSLSAPSDKAPDHEISSHGGVCGDYHAPSPTQHQIVKSAHVVAIFLAPHPTKRYSKGAVAEGVSRERLKKTCILY